MKTIISILSLSLLVSCTHVKIAYVDYDLLMNNYEAVKLQQEALKEKQTRYTKELEDLQAQFQLKVQDYYKNSPNMSADKRTELESTLKQEQETIQARQQQASQELQNENEENNNIFTMSVDSIVENYAKENKYNLIMRTLDKSNVIYGDETVDITSEILEILNN